MATTVFNKPSSSAEQDLTSLESSVSSLNTTVSNIGKIVKHSDTSTLKKYSYQLPGGLLITVIRKQVTTNISSATGSIYYNSVSAETWPITYSAAPIVFVGTWGVSGETNAGCWGYNTNPSTTSTGNICLMRGTSTTSSKIWVQWLGIGYKT